MRPAYGPDPADRRAGCDFCPEAARHAGWAGLQMQTAAARKRRPCVWQHEEGISLRILASPLGRPGNDLLSRVLRRSTIGAGAFHGRVRNGIGCSHPAITTRSAKSMLFSRSCLIVPSHRLSDGHKE